MTEPPAETLTGSSPVAKTIGIVVVAVYGRVRCSVTAGYD